MIESERTKLKENKSSNHPKTEEYDAYVVVSMSNLFHIFDKERTIDNPLKHIKEDENTAKRHYSRKLKSIKEESSEISDTDQRSLKIFIEHTSTKQVQSYKDNNNKQTNSQRQSQSSLNEDLSQSIKKSSCCDYFSNLVLYIFILLAINNTIVWIVHFMISVPKNKYYCYDSFSREFRICHLNDFCHNEGISNFIFTDSISSECVSDESHEINDYYLDFYLKDNSLFSLLNKKFSKTNEITSYYSIVIITTKKEGYIYSNTFRIICDRNIVDFIIAMAISMIIGNIVFGYCADLFGRKRILIIIILMEAIGGIIIFCITIYITSKNHFPKLERPTIITEFIKSSTRREFDFNSLNIKYDEKFDLIKQQVLESDIIRSNYHKNKIFISIGFVLIFSSNSSIYTISLAYLMENALTEDSMNLYYLFFHCAYPLSILLGSFLVTFLNSFHYPILIISLILIVLCVILMLSFYESQRFYFEYSFYKEITDFTKYIIGPENLRLNYKERTVDLNNEKTQQTNLNKDIESSNAFTIYYSKNSPRIATELKFKRENEKATFCNSMITKKIIAGLSRMQHFKRKQKKNRNTKENKIKRQAILTNPFTLSTFMKKEKQIRNHILIIFSFVLSISFVLNIAFTKITSIVFLPRSAILQKTIFGTWVFGYFLLYYVILYPFIYFIVKFLGISVILFPSLIITLVFSAVFEIVSLFHRSQEDLNTYLHDSFEIVFRDHPKILIGCNVLVLTASVGLLYSLYFYLTRLTKTVYRCSFYGICQVFVDITLIIGIGLEQFIEKSYFYCCLFSVIGIINSYFITSNEDTLNITEFREIEFDDVRNINHKHIQKNNLDE